MTRILFVVLAVVALLCSEGRTQEAIPIKFAEPKAGDRLKIEVEEESTFKMTVGSGGSAKVREQKSAKKVAFVEEVLVAGDSPGKRPKKLTRVYERAEFVTGDKTQHGAPLKAEILIEKKDGKYTFTVDGKDVTGPLGDDLKLTFDQPEVPWSATFPDKPVKTGESWKIDLAKAVPDAPDGVKFDREKGNGGGTLVRTEKRDGALYGVFELVVELPITDLGENSQLALKPTSKRRSVVTGSACIDGTTLGGKTVTKSTMAIESGAMDVVIVGKTDVTATKTVTQLPRK